MLPFPILAAVAPAAFAAPTGPFAWEAPAVEAQLAQDDVKRPAGQGAVFVPRMTDPTTTDEPVVVIEKNGEKVAEGRPGHRIVVPPGDYVALVGNASDRTALRVPVHVTADADAVVNPTWGVLRIEVVDAQVMPLRQSYEIIHSETRDVIGTGYGVDTLSGERLEAWALEPGLYRIVEPGANYRTRSDFVTVYVPEGGLVRFRLVIDEDTGQWRGGGVLLPDEFATVQSSQAPWNVNVVAGLDASLVQSSNVPGQTDSLIASGDIFADGYANWTHDRHRVALLGEIEEGLSQSRYGNSDFLPAVKTSDRLRGDALYTYLLSDRVGPYVRAGATSRAFATRGLATEDLTIQRTATDGTVTTEQVAANETWDLADPFQPTILREGAGANVALLQGRKLRLDWRAGLGLRQNLYGGSWVEDDDPNTTAVEYVQVDSFSQTGIESTLRGVIRPLPMVAWFTDLELFTPFDDMGRPAVEWSNTLSLHLTHVVSLNYVARVASEPQVSSQPQVDQSILARASWTLF